MWLMTSGFSYQPRGFDERLYYSIYVEFPHIPPLVIAVGHAEHGTAGSARCLRVVHRVADHQHRARRDAKAAAGMNELRGIGLFLRQGVSGDHLLEVTREAELLEQRHGEAPGLVRHAGERHPHLAQRHEPVAHARIEPAVPAVGRGVMTLEDRQRPLHERGVSERLGQRALDQLRYALADKRPDALERQRGTVEL